MDNIVLQAMAKWPNVPAVFGWLSLSQRGEWRIKNERVSNPIVCEFINRNYSHDEQGRWFFQNGPQRVYVLLDYTPWVYRFVNNTMLETHTGEKLTQINAACLDENGNALLLTEHGIGVVDDRDLAILLRHFASPDGECLSDTAQAALADLKPENWRGLWLNLYGRRLAMENIDSKTVCARFSFEPNPRQAEGDEECT